MPKKKPRKSHPGKARSKKASSTKRKSTHGIHRLKAVSEKPGWMGIEGIHLAFTTKEPHAIANFYREVLGFANATSQRPGSNLKPGFARRDDARGLLQLQSTRDSAIGFQDYNLAYHWVAQLGGRPPEEPLSAQVYLIVRNVERVFDHLGKKGVQFFGMPRVMPWGHKIVECADPEGRRLVFAEVLKKK